MMLLLLACQSEAERVCDDLCEELYVSCRFAAYPSLDSCLQGCLYDAEQGLALQSALECVEEAACDPFDIVNCQNRFGTSPN